MLPVAFVVLWAGYGLASYGYVLLKGWDIPFSQWWSPLHPWEWDQDTAATPPVIPPTQVNPSGTPKPVKARAQAH